jgi:hypothetical protein
MGKAGRVLLILLVALVVPACGKKSRKAAPPVPGTVVVTPTVGLATGEAGGAPTAQFTVVLGKQPTADVTIVIGTSNSLEGVPGTVLLTFTDTDWNIAQTVTVTGIDDSVNDGDQAYTITLAAVVSTDTTYAGVDPDDVSVTNADDDTPGFLFSATSGLATTENGGTATFDVVLTSQPSGDVTFDLSSSDSSEGSVSPTTLTFTAAAGPNAWNVPHTVTITGLDDAIPDNSQAYQILSTDASSTDTDYNLMVVPDVDVSNSDNDTVGITATPNAGLQTTEAGGTDTFNVVLNTQPTNSVTITVTSQDPAAGLVSVAGSTTPATTKTLTFTNGDWNVAQTVTLHGVNDALPTDNPPVAYAVRLDSSTSAEGAYAALPFQDLAATNLDDDVPGITVSPLSGLETTEAGGTATFTVRLDTVPSSPVTFTLTSSQTGEGTPDQATLVFLADATALNTQLVTLTGVQDALIDGDQTYTITVAIDTGATTEPNYSVMPSIVVNALNKDDDVPGFSLSRTSGLLTTEGGITDTFTVALTSIPSATVTITLSVTQNPAEATVTPTLTFLANASALTPQTVTVTGQDDALLDGNVAFTVTGTASGADPNYTGLTPFTVTGTNNDDESAPPGSTGWVKTGTPAIPTSPAPAWDDKAAQEPSVLKLAPNSYVMWYEGSNAGGQKHEQVGRATSADGLTWTKDAAPVLSHTGINGTFDKNGVGDPSVLFDGVTYRMWYAGRENAATKNKIGLATSTDGITWTRSPSNPVLIPTGGTFDTVGVSGPQVIFDAGTSTFHMWYTGLDGTGVTRIGHATSPDGIAWTKTAGAVLNAGSAGAFDAFGAKLCAVIQDGVSYRMWYVGLDVTGPAGRQKLGYASAAVADLGVNWTKFSGNPVLGAGAAGAFDEKSLWSPFVLRDNGVFRMWYGGENNAGLIRIGYAEIP